MAIKVLVPKELGRPLAEYSHGVVAAAGELVVVAGQVPLTTEGAFHYGVHKTRLVAQDIKPREDG